MTRCRKTAIKGISTTSTPDNLWRNFLIKHNTHACGTLRRNKNFLSKDVVTAKLTKGQVINKRSDQITVLNWRDRRDVIMLTTMHTGHVVQSTKLNMKKELIHRPKLHQRLQKNM
ncbi:hypothetical protein CDIK_3898 [Cucumispora dikerogammari]|nr:hypothetical protein CDIK_3898 [Cucumispora dikerogammari]